MTSGARLSRSRWPLLLILFAAAVLRLWHLGTLPAGLNPDEASIAYDAWALLHYGVDRNGQSWPVHLISWGSGQNALYAYLAFPFVALFGPEAFGIRILQALAGIATLPLVYIIALRTFDRRTALLAMAFVAFSPWHIALSRWALEANLVVAVFAAGVACLVAERWLAGTFLLGLSLYGYGSAWVAAPLMVAIALGLAARASRLGWGGAASAGAMFGVAALPIALFVALNSLRWPALMLGPVTIPRLTSAPRYETQAVGSVFDHIGALVRTVIGENDGLPWNATPPFGLFYHLLGVLAAIGIALIWRDRAALDWRRKLLLCWVAATVPIGLIQAVNINRINLIVVPLLILAAWAVRRLAEHRPHWRVIPVTGVLLALGLAAFWPAYARQDRPGFDTDLIPAIRRARAEGPGTVCITAQPSMAYVYALLADRTDPRRFGATVRYVDPRDPFRQVTAFEGHAFGACPTNTTGYVLGPGETAPTRAIARIGRYTIATRR